MRLDSVGNRLVGRSATREEKREEEFADFAVNRRK
jgi:hypothetical protein